MQWFRRTMLKGIGRIVDIFEAMGNGDLSNALPGSVAICSAASASPSTNSATD